MAYVNTIIDTERDPFLILDRKLTVVMVNDSYCKLFHADRRNIEGKNLYEAESGQWNIPILRAKLSRVVEDGVSFTGLEVSVGTATSPRKALFMNARDIYGEQNMILLAMDDVSELMTFADSVSKRLL